MNIKLLPCKKCGGQPYVDFCDTLDLYVTVYARIECSVCNNCTEDFTLPYDRSIGCRRMGELIEQLAFEHWNLINEVD